MQNLNPIEYKELRSGIEFCINDIISHCLTNGWDDKIEEYFNDINKIIFLKEDKIEDIKDKKFPFSIKYATELLNNIVYANQSTFIDYEIKISNIKSENKKSAIEKDSKELFYSILKNQYKILEKKYNLHLITPDISQVSLSNSLNKSIEELSNNELILE